MGTLFGKNLSKNKILKSQRKEAGGRYSRDFVHGHGYQCSLCQKEFSELSGCLTHTCAQPSSHFKDRNKSITSHTQSAVDKVNLECGTEATASKALEKKAPTAKKQFLGRKIKRPEKPYEFLEEKGYKCKLCDKTLSHQEASTHTTAANTVETSFSATSVRQPFPEGFAGKVTFPDVGGMGVAKQGLKIALALPSDTRNTFPGI